MARSSTTLGHADVEKNQTTPTTSSPLNYPSLLRVAGDPYLGHMAAQMWYAPPIYPTFSAKQPIFWIMFNVNESFSSSTLDYLDRMSHS